MRNIVLGAVAAAIVTVPAQGIAQERPWTGGYVSATGGSGFQPDDGAEAFGFDKNQDGNFGDTVTTVSGVNAFSPGFCGGAAVTALPGAGCGEDEDGATFGGRLGYDWQRGRLVLGLVGDMSSVQATDSVSAFSITPAFYTFTRDVERIGALRARVGAGSERFLVYATGGGVRASMENRFTTSNAVNTFVPTTASTSAYGYQGGGGLEYRFSKMSVAAEYLYTRLRNDEEEFTVRVQGPAPATNPFILTNPSGTDLRRTDAFSFGAARLVLSYRF